MKNNYRFPITIIDDFYQDPDAIRKYALSLPYDEKPDGTYPGRRTVPIHEIDIDLHNYCAEKFFFVFFDRSTSLKWEIKIQFQLTFSYDEDPNSFLNQGWIHQDSNTVLSGVLYLNKDPDKDTGTAFYKIKPHVDIEQLNQNNKCIENLYLYNNNENYAEEIQSYNNQFIETAYAENIYNRLVVFDGKYFHGAKKLHVTTEPRLTQTFFVKYLESSSPAPLDRVTSK